jgi:hypothetical protein
MLALRCWNHFAHIGICDAGIVLTVVDFAMLDVCIGGDYRGYCDVGIVLPMTGFVMFDSFGLCWLCDVGIISPKGTSAAAAVVVLVQRALAHLAGEAWGGRTSFPGGCFCDERSGGGGGVGAEGTGTLGGRGLGQTHPFPWRLLL